LPGDITVLMAVYNGVQYLNDAVESVLAQTYPDWKLLVVDDGSTDGTRTVLRRFLWHPRLEVLPLEANRGQGMALNAGLHHIDTPFFVQLDADDWFEPDTLEVLLRHMRRQPREVSMVYGNMAIWFDTQPIIRKGVQFADKFEFLCYAPTVCPRFYRTQAVRDVGGWPVGDPFHGRYMEDKLLLTSLIETTRFAWVDHLLYNHRRHDGQQTDLYRARYNYLIRWLVTRKLREWGDEYRADFSMQDGWTMVSLKKTRDADS